MIAARRGKLGLWGPRRADFLFTAERHEHCRITIEQSAGAIPYSPFSKISMFFFACGANGLPG